MERVVPLQNITLSMMCMAVRQRFTLHYSLVRQSCMASFNSVIPASCFFSSTPPPPPPTPLIMYNYVFSLSLSWCAVLYECTSHPNIVMILTLPHRLHCILCLVFPFFSSQLLTSFWTTMWKRNGFEVWNKITDVFNNVQNWDVNIF